VRAGGAKEDGNGHAARIGVGGMVARTGQPSLIFTAADELAWMVDTPRAPRFCWDAA
jgi:hypothetical protein